MKATALKVILATTTLATALALSISAGAHSAQAADWAGSYAGVQLGFGETDAETIGNGSAAGFQVGHDWQVGNWVAGVGVDALFANGYPGFNDLDTIARVKFRGGYDLGETLVFVSAGASFASDYDLGNDWGHFVGVGLEHRLSDSWSVSGEVTQHRFDDFNGFGKMEPTVVSIGLNYRF